jgi:hypothetical protein
MSLLLLLRGPSAPPVYRPDPPARPSRAAAAEHAALVAPEIRPARPAAVARPN